MTPDGRQDLAAVIAKMREVIAERLLCDISQQKGRVVATETLEHWLALLLAEAQLSENAKENADTRGADSQYGAPLATASENQLGPDK